jgi:xanthine dehydrogenase accessory factor
MSMPTLPDPADWRAALAELGARGDPHALVTVVATEGSAPRDAGAKMVVTAQGQFGSIGGGHLEFKALAQARAMIAANARGTKLQDYALGPQLGQCCGGRVTLLVECFARPAFVVALFGAGHVGRALVEVLAGVEARILWIDSRAEAFPTVVPAGVETVVAEQPEDEVADLPKGCFAVVMTHRHDVDLAIVTKLLKRREAAYVGVIGSDTKRARFASQLTRRGFAPATIATLRCPIGVAGIESKNPRDIAIAVAAELLCARDSVAVPVSDQPATDVKNP